MNDITGNVRRLLSELPDNVDLVAVAKTRSVDEVAEAIAAGVKIVGQNYLQEALPVIAALRERYGEQSSSSVSWHFIGHLQSNKIGQVINNFEMIETVDSVSHASRLQGLLSDAEMVMPVLLEINSGREQTKQGLLPEAVPSFLEEIREFDRVQVRGLMTMGPWGVEQDILRQAFRDTTTLFGELDRAALPGVKMKTLSMGMSASWQLAVEEGANLVRIGADLFGPRSV